MSTVAKVAKNLWFGQGFREKSSTSSIIFHWTTKENPPRGEEFLPLQQSKTYSQSGKK